MEAEAAATAAAAAAEAAEITASEEEDPSPKGPIGKMLKAGNDMAAKASEKDAARFAEASASAMDSHLLAGWRQHKGQIRRVARSGRSARSQLRRREGK